MSTCLPACQVSICLFACPCRNSLCRGKGGLTFVCACICVWRGSSIKGSLPLKVVFNWRSSSIEGHLPLKVVFHWRSSSIEGCLPLKVVFHRRSYSMLCVHMYCTMIDFAVVSRLVRALTSLHRLIKVVDILSNKHTECLQIVVVRFWWFQDHSIFKVWFFEQSQP